jgi:hypothetical protein
MPEQFVPSPALEVATWMAAKRPGPLEAFPRDLQTYDLMLRKNISRARDDLDFVISSRLANEYIKDANGAFLRRSASFTGHCAICSPRK